MNGFLGLLRHRDYRLLVSGATVSSLGGSIAPVALAFAVLDLGGSATDLAWLNDLELARLVCRAPVPVLTGIGHERDSTIVDRPRKLPISTIRPPAGTVPAAVQRRPPCACARCSSRAAIRA